MEFILHGEKVKFSLRFFALMDQHHTSAQSIVICMLTALPFLYFFSSSGGQNNAKYAFQYTFKHKTKQRGKKKKKKKKE